LPSTATTSEPRAARRSGK
jgi:dTMP kinase